MLFRKYNVLCKRINYINFISYEYVDNFISKRYVATKFYNNYEQKENLIKCKLINNYNNENTHIV